MRKITQREIPFLDEGTYLIDRGLYFRKRGNYGSYFLRVQVDGERHDVSLGSARDLTITVAKAHATKIRSQILEGIYPWEKQKTVIEHHRFADVLEGVVDTIALTAQWKDERKMRGDWIHSLEDYCVPVFGRKDVADITRDDVLKAVGDIWLTKHELAKKVRSRLERVFALMIVRGWRKESNPALWRGNLDIFLPPSAKVHSTSHQEAMTFEEAREIARRFRHSEFISHKAILFGLLTCARASEFLGAKWSEIDWEERIWTCPAERMKVARPTDHRVPLPSQLVEMLTGLKGRGGELIFPSEKTGRRLTLDTPRIVLNKNMDRHVTMHGCRSTFRDWCAENEVPEELAERSLAHLVGSEVRRAYQRSDLLDLRRPVLQAWADALLNDTPES